MLYSRAPIVWCDLWMSLPSIHNLPLCNSFIISLLCSEWIFEYNQWTISFWLWLLCCCLVASVVSDSVRLQRRQPTRLPRPWDSPDKNTGVGCHFLLQCRKVKRESEVAQLCPNLSDPTDCSLPGSSVYGIFQARALEWGAITLELI